MGVQIVDAPVITRSASARRMARAAPSPSGAGWTMWFACLGRHTCVFGQNAGRPRAMACRALPVRARQPPPPDEPSRSRSKGRSLGPGRRCAWRARSWVDPCHTSRETGPHSRGMTTSAISSSIQRIASPMGAPNWRSGKRCRFGPLAFSRMARGQGHICQLIGMRRANTTGPCASNVSMPFSIVSIAPIRCDQAPVDGIGRRGGEAGSSRRGWRGHTELAIRSIRRASFSPKAASGSNPFTSPAKGFESVASKRVIARSRKRLQDIGPVVSASSRGRDCAVPVRRRGGAPENES